MKINIAHINIQGINCLICDADYISHTAAGRKKLLAQLTAAAQIANLRVDKSVLAFMEYGQLTFFGAPDLVQYLSTNGLSNWTGALNI